jgi:hypothetical protein
MMDKVQKHISFNTNTPSSESYRNHVGSPLLIKTGTIQMCVEALRIFLAGQCISTYS